MTLGIARLYFEIGTLAGTAPDQFEQPAGASDARDRQQGRRQNADAPAGNGRRRLTKIGRLSLPPPAADGDPDRAGVLRGKLEPPGGGHGKLRHLGDHGAEPAMAQSFFKAGEDGFLVTRLDVDHAVRRQTG